MERGTIILFLVLLLSLGIVAAEEDIEFTVIDSTTNLQPEEIGEYQLQLENLGSRELNIQISVDPYVGLSTSDFEYVFVDPEYLILSGHETTTVNVTIKLKESVTRQKRYQTYITATALNYDLEEDYDLQIFAMPPESAVKITLSETPDKIGPGSQLVIDMVLKNMVDQDLTNVDVYVTSQFFSDQQTIELFEDQEKELQFAFNIPKTAPAEEYEYNIRLYNEDLLLSSATGTFFVDENLIEQHFYNELQLAKELRVDTQYYVTEEIDLSKLKKDSETARSFVLGMEEVIENITEKQVSIIRNKLNARP